MNNPSQLNTSFQHYLETSNIRGAAIPAGLQELLLAVAQTCSTLSHEVAQGALIGLLGSAGTGNVQGEVQQKLDVIANDLLIEGVQHCKSLAGLASEEMELPVVVQGTGDYLLLFDPLDGSSNLRLFIVWTPSGGGGLCRLWAANHDGFDFGRWRGDVYLKQADRRVFINQECCNDFAFK